MASVLRHLFRPQDVAVIGASDDATKLGGRLFRQNRALGFAGRLHPVNPKAATVQGIRAVPDIESVQVDLDCAIIALPALAVPEAVEACGRRGVPLAVVFASGFAEHDEAGIALQSRITAIARAGRVRLVGPNSMGALSLAHRFSATFTAIEHHHNNQGWPRPGRVAVASQSGAVGTQILVQLRERGVGIAHWLATGNEADLDVADAIACLAEDEDVHVIAAYLEGAKDGAKLRAALRQAREAGRIVVVLKVGRSAEGARAAATHTASLAGEDAAFDAVFAAEGALRAASLEQLVDIVAAADACPLPRARALGIATNSGGVGVMLADAAAAHGIAVPELPQAVQTRLREMSPLASPRNPADTGAAGMNDLRLVLRFADAVLDAGLPATISFLSHLGLIDGQITALLPDLADLRARFPDRPQFLVGNLLPGARQAAQMAGWPVFEEPVRAVAALDALARLAEFRAAPVDDDLPELPENPAPTDGAGSETAGKRLLRAIGIPATIDILAHSAAEAIAAAGEDAVALKIASPDIAHKSDLGGVRLDVRGAEGVAEAHDSILAAIREAAPDARIDGVLVSPMAGPGVEMILGVVHDAVFGPMVLLGMGGVFAEILRDTVLRPAPFGRAAARSMIRSLRGFPLLDGARGRPPSDVAALADALVRLSVWADRQRGCLASVDINPLLVRPSGAGVLALDALVVPA